jgi:hypothetical protein
MVFNATLYNITVISWRSVLLVEKIGAPGISKAKNEFGQNPEENIILTGPSQYAVILTGSLTKTNRENINVKHNIIQLKTGCEGSNKFIHMALSAMNYLLIDCFTSLILSNMLYLSVIDSVILTRGFIF